MQVEVEPRDRKEEDHCAPDGYIYGLRPGKKVAFDVAVARYGNSVLGSAHIFAQDGLKAAAECEKSKLRKFEAKLKQTGDDFVALVVETYGAVGKEARMLLKVGLSYWKKRSDRTIWRAPTLKSLAHFKEGRGAVGGGSEAGESGVNKILFGYKQDFFYSNAWHFDFFFGPAANV